MISAVGWGEFANPNAFCAKTCWGSCLTPTYMLNIKNRTEYD